MHFSSHLKHSADSCYTAVYIPTDVIYISTNVPYISTDSPFSGNYTTIQDAVNNATSGETIIVYPEIYTENVNVSMADLNIISYSGNPDDTVVKHLDVLSHDFKINANNVTISGFNITGTYPIFRSIFIFLFIL